MLVDVMIIKETEFTLFKGNVIIYFIVSTGTRSPFYLAFNLFRLKISKFCFK